jgi:hypothetical protein
VVVLTVVYEVWGLDLLGGEIEGSWSINSGNPLRLEMSFAANLYIQFFLACLPKLAAGKVDRVF